MTTTDTPSVRPTATTETIVASYVAALNTLLRSLDVQAVDAAVGILRGARDRGQSVFVAGNGGSASTATHLVNDLGKAAKRAGARPMRVMSLCDNVSWITALGNDEGYERVFSGQLENFAVPGDVLVLISASGNSPNLVDALALARQREVTTIALLGFDGGALKDAVDLAVWLPTEYGAYGLVESAHSVVCDLFTTCIMDDGPTPPVAGTQA